MSDHDAFLLLSFGGPEGPDDVLPFLERVLRGRDVPRERMLAVAEHYHAFGGRSPINDHNRALLAAVKEELARRGSDLPVYWGNRNWHPLVADTVTTMRDDGVERAVVLATSAFGSYSGCRQYREDLEEAAAAIADPPILDKLPPFWSHPGFLDAMADRLSGTLAQAAGTDPLVLFSAHSIPQSMAVTSPYEAQLRVASMMVAERSRVGRWELVFQSRSGPPTQPWLEPDVTDRIRSLPAGSTVVVCPIGFVSDHMEVVWDLDTEAAAAAAEVGVRLLRAPTVGTHPQFVSMVADLALAPDLSAACETGCCPPPDRSGPPGR